MDKLSPLNSPSSHKPSSHRRSKSTPTRHRRSSSTPIMFTFKRILDNKIEPLSPELKHNTNTISSSIDHRIKTSQQFELLIMLVVKLKQELKHRMEVFNKFQQRLSTYKNMLSKIEVTQKTGKTLSSYLEEIHTKVDELFSEKAFKHKDFFDVTSILENKINSVFMYSP